MSQCYIRLSPREQKTSSEDSPVHRTTLPAAAIIALIPAAPAIAQQAATTGDQQPAPGAAQSQSAPSAPASPQKGQAIVITGRRLDVARDSITPSLGASQYTFNKQSLEKQPRGTN